MCQYDTDTGNSYKGGAELDEAGHKHLQGGAYIGPGIARDNVELGAGQGQTGLGVAQGDASRGWNRDVGSPSFCGNCYTFVEARLTDKGYYCNTCIHNSMAKDLYERQGGTPYHTFTEADWERESRFYPIRPQRKNKAKQNPWTLIRKCNDGT